MLFGLAIKKSNVKADLMQIELSGTEIDFVGTQIRNRHSLLTSPRVRTGHGKPGKSWN